MTNLARLYRKQTQFNDIKVSVSDAGLPQSIAEYPELSTTH